MCERVCVCVSVCVCVRVRVCVCVRARGRAYEKVVKQKHFIHLSFRFILIDYDRRIVSNDYTIYLKTLSLLSNMIFVIDIKHENVIIITLPLASPR